MQPLSSVVQVRKRSSRSDRSKRARERGVLEGDAGAGTEYEERYPRGGRKCRQSSTVTPPHAGVDSQRSGSATGQVCSTVLLNEPQHVEREKGKTKRDGEYNTDYMASSPCAEEHSNVHKMESEASANGDSRSDGVFDGCDGEVYVGGEQQGAEGGERPAEVMVDGRDAMGSTSETTICAEMRVEAAEDFTANKNTMTVAAGTGSTASPATNADVEPVAMGDSTQELGATITMRQPTDRSTQQSPQNTNADAPKSLRDSHRGALWIEDQVIVESVPGGISKEVTIEESEVEEAGQADREWPSPQPNVDGVSGYSEVS
ncbi:unnamed protein product [Sphacelaria rigidula]